MKDTHTVDVVTFDFKGTRVCCLVRDSTDYQINFLKMHNVSK